jgi:hypothetical protein
MLGHTWPAPDEEKLFEPGQARLPSAADSRQTSKPLTLA